jgi:hypothetical protein
MSTVVSPRETLPYLDFISFSRSRSCGTNSSSRDRKSCKEAIAENNALLEGQIVPVSNGNDLT